MATHTSSVDLKGNDDNLDIKEECYEDDVAKKGKKNRWISIGLAALMLSCILSAAIAIPVTLTRKNDISSNDDSSNDDIINLANYNAAAAATAAADAAATTTSIAETNVSAASLPPPKKSNRRLLVTNKETAFHPPKYAHQISPYSSLIRLKTFTPPDEGRVFVMGDIHGQLDEMNALLDKIKFQASKDVLILTGDLVFRGPDSVGVVRRARELNALCVRGNHDDKVVRFRGYQNKYGRNGMPSSHKVMPEGDVGDPLRFSNKHRRIAR